MHFYGSCFIYLDGYLLIGRQDISRRNAVADLRYRVFANSQTFNEDLTVFIGLKGLVISVCSCHTEGEALYNFVRRSFYDLQRAFLRCIDKSNTCFVFNCIDLSIFLNGHRINILIQQESFRRCLFTDKIFSIAKVAHLVNTIAQFAHFSQQFIAVIQFSVTVFICIDFKNSTGQLIVRIIFIHLCQLDAAGNKLIDQFNFHNLVYLADGYRNFFIGKYITRRAFNLTDDPVSIWHFSKRKTTVIFRCGSCNRCFGCKFLGTNLKDTDKRTA